MGDVLGPSVADHDVRFLRENGGESNPEIHFYLGEVYMELEEYGKAESEYNKAKGYY